MKRVILSASVIVVAAATVLYGVQSQPQTSPSQWLKQLVGEWENESEVVADPSQPPMKFKGTETGRAIGESWVILDMKGDSPAGPMNGVLTVGYDADKKEFVGTWIDSMSSYLWKYKGTLDAAANTLTLETEGPSPMSPGKTAKFRERIEFKSPAQRVFTSSIQDEKGEWMTFVTINARRKS